VHCGWSRYFLLSVATLNRIWRDDRCYLCVCVCVCVRVSVLEHKNHLSYQHQTLYTHTLLQDLDMQWCWGEKVKGQGHVHCCTVLVLSPGVSSVLVLKATVLLLSLCITIVLCFVGTGGKKCSVSGCQQLAVINFDSSTLPGYNSLHAAQKTQLYCKLQAPPLL